MFRGKKKYRTDGYIFGKLKKSLDMTEGVTKKQNFRERLLWMLLYCFWKEFLNLSPELKILSKFWENRVDFSYKVLEHLDLFFENKWLQKTFYRTWAWAIFQKSSHKVSASLRRCLISLWATNIEDKYIVNYRIFLLFSTQFRNIKFVWIYIFVCYI